MPRGDRDGSVIRRKVKRVVNGKEKTETWLYVRCRWTDETGREREKKRRILRASEAPTVKAELREEIKRELAAPASAQADKTFADLAKLYRAEYLVEPVFQGGRLVRGLRSHVLQKGRLSRLEKYFASFKVRAITHDDLERFKRRRLAQPVAVVRNRVEARDGVKTKTKVTEHRERSIASVNRDLALLRRLLSVAVQKRWIDQNPFSLGDSLISTASETARVRILTRDEEEAILSACGERERVYERNGKRLTARDGGGRRLYLRPLVVAALDTAMRKGELLKLRWRDVDLEGGVIYVQAGNTKTLRERVTPVTVRLRAELARLWEASAKDPEALVFGVSDIKGPWRCVLRAAGVTGVHFHDLRHTAITWMLEAGMPAAQVMKVSGHTQWVTFLRYVNVNAEAARAAADMLDARRARLEDRESVH